MKPITLNTKNADRVQEYAGIIADLGGTMTIEPTPRTPLRKKCWHGNRPLMMSPLNPERYREEFRLNKHGEQSMIVRRIVPVPSSYIFAGEPNGLPDNSAGDQ